MSYTSLEATSAEQLATFKQTVEYAELVRNATEVSEGMNPQGDYDEDEKPLPIYWVLVEKNDEHDNATFRLNANGVPQYWASGVEM